MRLSLSVCPEFFRLGLPSSSLILWLYLDATDGLSRFCPTQQQIADALGWSVTTVKAAIGRLVRADALAVLSSSAAYGTDRYVTLRPWERVPESQMLDDAHRAMFQDLCNWMRTGK